MENGGIDGAPQSDQDAASAHAHAVMTVVLSVETSDMITSDGTEVVPRSLELESDPEMSSTYDALTPSELNIHDSSSQPHVCEAHLSGQDSSVPARDFIPGNDHRCIPIMVEPNSVDSLRVVSAPTSSDLGSAIDRIIESTIGADLISGCIAVTSASDGAETTGLLVLRTPDEVTSVHDSEVSPEGLMEGSSTSISTDNFEQPLMEVDQPIEHSGIPMLSDNRSEQPLLLADRSGHPLLPADQSRQDLLGDDGSEQVFHSADQSQQLLLGDDEPGLINLEEMIEVVVVQQFKCKLCPYQSKSRDNLINHMKDRHLQTRGSQNKKRGRGRPPNGSSSREHPPTAMDTILEDNDDDIVDAGAIDDHDEDSDYNPAQDGVHGRMACKPNASHCSPADRVRRRPGRPRKYPLSSDRAPLAEKVMGGSESSANPASPGEVFIPLDLDLQHADEGGVEGVNGQSESLGSSVDVSASSRKVPQPTKRFQRRGFRRYLNRYSYRSSRPSSRPYFCRICGSRFLSADDLHFHVESHDTVHPEHFRCLQCPYHCRRWSSLKEHMYNHEGVKPHKCEECSYTSVYRKDVFRHAAVHSKDRKTKKEVVPRRHEYPCPVCHRMYYMQKRLTQHMKTHSAEKPHMCDKCGKSFKKRHTFKNHLLTHVICLGNGKFKCEFCEFSCENKKFLLNHQLAHTNERPFRCDYCPYATTKEEFLVSHLAIKHTGEKPFSCDQCHFSTRHRKNLRLHVRCRHPADFTEWLRQHPQELVRSRSQPLTQEQILELRKRHVARRLPANKGTRIKVSVQAEAVAEASEKPVTATTLIFDAGRSGDAHEEAQVALSLLLNMSSAPGLVSPILQPTMENDTDAEASSSALSKVVMLHVNEHWETVYQENEVNDPGANDGNSAGRMAAASDFADGAPTPSIYTIHNCHPVGVRDVSSTLAGGKFSRSANKNNGALVMALQPQIQVAEEKVSNTFVSSGSLPGLASLRRFSCKFCSTAFSGRAELESHKRSHDGDLGFRCLDCNFSASTWFAEHMGQHAGLRPHKCSQCSFASKNKKDLRRHLLTHTNEKPFSCHICGQRFNRNGHLKLHMDRLHCSETHKDCTESTSLSSKADGTSSPSGDLVIPTSEQIMLGLVPGAIDQEQATYIEHVTADGETFQQVIATTDEMGHVQYLISQDGLPQEYIVALPEGHQLQLLQNGQIQDGELQLQQIEYEQNQATQHLLHEQL
uniref:zinc finger protein 335 isoform X2 n=1 Tax=Myxine glutinosa TaxID=7769 RepID=UPI00358F57A1